MPQYVVVFIILAITQLTGWGAVGFLPVTATKISADLGMPLPTVFLGTSIMFVAMGLVAPWLGKAFRRFGARRIMTLGAALIACGLYLVGTASSAGPFLLAWGIVGIAGAMFLTTAAYIYLADFAADRSRGLIGTLMLVTGLAGAVFWPATAFLEQIIGWRATVVGYATIMVLLVGPLVWLGLPETTASNEPVVADAGKGTRKGTVFWLIVSAVALNSFVTFGVEAIGIELFRAMGADLAFAVGLASLLGLFKVGGRLIDLLGGRKWDGLATALVSGAVIPIGLLALYIWEAQVWSVAAYLIFFGVGSGAFAVARATMPLTFFRRADYAAIMSTIALPLNLISALAPPCLAAALTATGPSGVLGLLSAFSAAAFLLLLRLNRLRPTTEMVDTV